jgi:dTDP-4-amino-4,6-dideoxygalactose transaminase
MSQAGIQTSVHYPLLSSFSVWRNYFGSGKSPSLPVALSVADRLVTLPMGPHLNAQSIEMIAQALKKCLNVEETNLKQDEL